MTVQKYRVKDGPIEDPLKARLSVMGVRRGTLRIILNNIKNKGFESVEDCAGPTVEGTTVRHKGPSRDT